MLEPTPSQRKPGEMKPETEVETISLEIVKNAILTQLQLMGDNIQIEKSDIKFEKETISVTAKLKGSRMGNKLNFNLIFSITNSPTGLKSKFEALGITPEEHIITEDPSRFQSLLGLYRPFIEKIGEKIPRLLETTNQFKGKKIEQIGIKGEEIFATMQVLESTAGSAPITPIAKEKAPKGGQGFGPSIIPDSVPSSLKGEKINIKNGKLESEVPPKSESVPKKQRAGLSPAVIEEIAKLRKQIANIPNKEDLRIIILEEQIRKLKEGQELAQKKTDEQILNELIGDSLPTSGVVTEMPEKSPETQLPPSEKKIGRIKAEIRRKPPKEQPKEKLELPKKEEKAETTPSVPPVIQPKPPEKVSLWKKYKGRAKAALVALGLLAGGVGVYKATQHGSDEGGEADNKKMAEALKKAQEDSRVEQQRQQEAMRAEIDERLAKLKAEQDELVAKNTEELAKRTAEIEAEKARELEASRQKIQEEERRKSDEQVARIAAAMGTSKKSQEKSVRLESEFPNRKAYLDYLERKHMEGTLTGPEAEKWNIALMAQEIESYRPKSAQVQEDQRVVRAIPVAPAPGMYQAPPQRPPYPQGPVIVVPGPMPMQGPGIYGGFTGQNPTRGYPRGHRHHHK